MKEREEKKGSFIFIDIIRRKIVYDQWLSLVVFLRRNQITGKYLSRWKNIFLQQ